MLTLLTQCLNITIMIVEYPQFKQRQKNYGRKNAALHTVNLNPSPRPHMRNPAPRILNRISGLKFLNLDGRPELFALEIPELRGHGGSQLCPQPLQLRALPARLLKETFSEDSRL